MQKSDSTKYKQLEATAKKWYDIEAQNLKELAALQKTVAKPDNQGIERAAAIAQRFNIGYQPAARALVLKNSFKGKLIVVDLRGKVVSSFNLSDLQAKNNVTLPLPATLGTGIYVARLEGVNGIEQARITITK
jgi:hypothetical protein